MKLKFNLPIFSETAHHREQRVHNIKHIRHYGVYFSVS